MRTQFKDLMLELSAKDDKLVLLFGDISVFLFREFSAKYPERFFNAGICENTLISLAAGFSSQGFYPFVHSIAPFVTERSYEQIKLDLCYNNFGANIVSCGASFDYAWDGASHHCYTDLAILRHLPAIEVMQPGSKNELTTLIKSQYNNGKTSYFRLAGDEHGEAFSVEFGKGVIVRDSNAELTIVTAGPMLGNVLKATSDLKVNIVYFHTIKPFDKEVLDKFKYTKMVVVHDAYGLFEAVAEGVPTNVEYLGLPDDFCGCYGTFAETVNDLGLSPEPLRERIIAVSLS